MLGWSRLHPWPPRYSVATLAYLSFGSIPSGRWPTDRSVDYQPIVR